MGRSQVPILAEDPSARAKPRVELAHARACRRHEVHVEEGDVDRAIEGGEGVLEEPLVEGTNLDRAVLSDAALHRPQAAAECALHEAQRRPVEEVVLLLVGRDPPEGVEDMQVSASELDRATELCRARARAGSCLDHRETGASGELEDTLDDGEQLLERVVAADGVRSLEY